MKVNSDRDISFKSFYTNPVLKKGLEFAADNGALFAATTSLVLSASVRPASVWLAPNTDKETKKTLFAKYIASALTGFLIMLGVSKPISRSIKQINKNPECFLKQETIDNLKVKEQNLVESDNYKFATQLFKLGISAAVAIPKAILTASIVPKIMQFLYPSQNKQKYNQDFNDNINFKANPIAKSIGKVFDNKNFQNFVEKYKDTNFPMHIIALTDALTTATFAATVAKNPDIEKNKQNVLINNAIISTFLSICLGYTSDKLLDKPTQKFINKFREINRNQPNLEKQVEGIKIAKPILLVGLIYYILIPLVSAFMSDKISSKTN